SLMSVAAAAPAFELPFMVQGPWDDPIILPDPQSRIQRSGAAAPILESVRRNGPAAVRSMIDRLTGAAPSQNAAPPAETTAPAPPGRPRAGRRGTKARGRNPGPPPRHPPHRKAPVDPPDQACRGANAHASHALTVPGAIGRNQRVPIARQASTDRKHARNKV